MSTEFNFENFRDIFFAVFKSVAIFVFIITSHFPTVEVATISLLIELFSICCCILHRNRQPPACVVYAISQFLWLLMLVGIRWCFKDPDDLILISSFITILWFVKHEPQISSITIIWAVKREESQPNERTPICSSNV